MARRRDRLDDLAERITAAGGRASSIEADVTDEAAVRAAVDRTVAEFGRLDTVVANAGRDVAGPDRGRADRGVAQMVDLNVLGLMYTAHAALPHLLAGRRARRRARSPTSF